MLLRFLLGLAAGGYLAVIGLRNFLYSNGRLKIRRVDAAVISIGNITAGGTGKTPLVIWLCNSLRNSKFKCAILTRGYKTTQDSRLKTQDYGNEPAILTQSCPQAKVIVNPDRLAGAAKALGEFGAEVLIMDDGFQHRRLARDLDIVTIDATNPFGYGKMLPAGLLREPVTTLKRADAVVITRCDQTDEARLARLEEKLKSINPDMMIARSIHAPMCAKSLEDFVIPTKVGIQKNDKTVDSCLRRNDNLEQLKEKRVFAFCGIGNPDAFLDTIKRLGANLVGSKIYNDHHQYAENDTADICKQAEHSKADLILTTQKDWYSSCIVRDMQCEKKGTQYAMRNTRYDIPFAYLAIELKFTAGEDKLTRLIEDVLAGRILQN